MIEAEVYTIVAKENLTELYDEIELHLCDTNSGFGRNLDALNDVLTGGFGKLYKNKTEKIKTLLIVKNSSTLPQNVRKIFEQAISASKEYYDPHYIYSYEWLTINLI